MTSYQERSEINRRLADQAYFDAKLKKVEPQKKDVRIGGMDGQTGRYQVFHADGGFSNNGVRTFDGTPPSDRFVRGQQNPNSNAIALGYRDYVRTAFVNRIEEEEITTQIIFLFQKENKLYVGGDRDEPELIYEAEEGESITQARITKTGEGIDDYKAMFVSEKGDSKIYLNTYLDGSVSTLSYTPVAEGIFGIPSFGFNAADGSFIGQGTRTDISPLPPAPDLVTQEEIDEIIRDVLRDLSAEYEATTGNSSTDLQRVYYYPRTNATNINDAVIEISNSPTLGIVYGTGYLITVGREGVGGDVILSATTTIFPIAWQPPLRGGQSVSLFARPEDDVLGGLQVDNYPSESRVLTVYYTESASISTSEFDSIKAFDSESIIFVKSGVISSKGAVNKTLEIPLDFVNNFIGVSVYTTSDDIRNEDGTGIATINKYDISTDPTNVEEGVSIEYFGIPEDLKDYIVNYSVFF